MKTALKILMIFSLIILFGSMAFAQDQTQAEIDSAKIKHLEAEIARMKNGTGEVEARITAVEKAFIQVYLANAKKTLEKAFMDLYLLCAQLNNYKQESEKMRKGIEGMINDVNSADSYREMRDILDLYGLEKPKEK